jgi:cysteine desulfurase family protein
MPDIYLDHASTSFPKPETVYRAVESFARTCGASPGRGGYPRASAAGEMVRTCRRAVAALLGARDPSRIAFTSNSTEALNCALKGLLTKPGDHAVVTVLEHNAVLRPLRALERTRGITWTPIPCAPDGTVDPIAVGTAIRPETRVVCAVHASNVLGTILPVAEMAREAHARGVPVLVDASQTVGAVPVSVEDLEIDLLAFTGHKSMLGPPGTGGLYIREGLSLPTWKEGGTGILSESLDPPEQMPEYLETGTANGWGLAGLLAAAEFLLGTSIPTIRERELALLARLTGEFRATEGVTVYGPLDPARKVGIVSINVGTVTSSEIGRLLAERYGIAVRTGLHCSPLAHQAIGTAQTGGAVRFGIGMSTTEVEIDAAVAAIRELAAAVYRRKKARASQWARQSS